MKEDAREALGGEPEHEADDKQRDRSDAAAERKHEERRTRDTRGGGERYARAFEEGEEGHGRGTRKRRRSYCQGDSKLAAREQAEGPRVRDRVAEEGLHKHPGHAERAAGDDRCGNPRKANIEDDLAGKVGRLRPCQRADRVGQRQRDLSVGQRQQRERGERGEEDGAASVDPRGHDPPPTFPVRESATRRREVPDAASSRCPPSASPDG